MRNLGFPPENLLVEPEGRSTAPAIAYAAACLQARHPNDVMAVFPADHHVGDPEPFLAALERGREAARAGHLVTLGLAPRRAETGYGYIQKGEALLNLEGVFHASRFTEKPDQATAEGFIKRGDYFWNTGIRITSYNVCYTKLLRPDGPTERESVGGPQGAQRPSGAAARLSHDELPATERPRHQPVEVRDHVGFGEHG